MDSPASDLAAALATRNQIATKKKSDRNEKADQQIEEAERARNRTYHTRGPTSPVLLNLLHLLLAYDQHMSM